MQIQKNISLAKYTTFKIGGSAKFFVEVKERSELSEAIHWAEENNQKIFILSGGSNLLISDNGFDGLVIKIDNTDFKIIKNNPLSSLRKQGSRPAFHKIPAYAGMTLNSIKVGAGWNLKQLIEKCWVEDLIGMKSLYGIYGSLGGAIRGNAGAFGSEISDFVESLEIFDTQSKQTKTLDKKDCDFVYRGSIIKDNPNLIILSATLKLTKQNPDKEKTEAKEMFVTRCSSQDTLPSAGCVFKNIKDEKFEEFIKDNPDTRLPDIFMERKAIPAAWLIEETGLKGKQIGSAKISDSHANFIVNTGSATAEQVLELISLIKMKVRNQFKVQLSEEIGLVGF